MFTRNQRPLLIGACLILALVAREPIVTYAALVAAALFVHGYFRYSTVWAAWREYKAKRHDRARALLAEVAAPTLLAPSIRAYYHWLSGLLIADGGDLEESKRRLLAASVGRLRTTSDRALVHAQLATLGVELQDAAFASHHLSLSKGLPHKPALDSVIEQLQQRVVELSSSSRPDGPMG